MDTEALSGALRSAFASLVEADEVDIEIGPGPGEVEVVAETWTLHLEGWPDRPLAWLALDEEPEDTKELRAARIAAMGSEAMRALIQADAQVNGGIRTALIASDDPLSMDLASALATGSAPPPTTSSPL